MPFRDVFDQVFRVWSVIAAVVFGLVCIILVLAIVRNRAKWRQKLPFRAHKNTPLELGYVVLLAGIAGALVYGSFRANAVLHDGVGLGSGVSLTKAATTSPATRIDVTAFRWCWDFRYRAAPAVDVTGQCTTGSYPTVVVPAGQPVEFDITSRDVIHGFWLPDFMTKRLAYPNHVNTLRMVFPREGQWRGRCYEYCGTHHVTMDFYVRAVSPAKYQQFLQSGGATA